MKDGAYLSSSDWSLVSPPTNYPSGETYWKKEADIMGVA